MSTATTTTCRICAAEAHQSHRGVVLKRHDVTYYACPSCQYWFTEEPYWLDEAYAGHEDDIDKGRLQRNLSMARRLGIVLPRLMSQGPYVDWAGGSGMLVRLMRDVGFDFYWQDLYAQNEYAKGLEWQDHASEFNHQAAIVSAIEVMEHVADPLPFLREVLAETKATTVLFTECLHDGTTYDPNWWYLMPWVGQHISFYSARTLEVMASQLGLHVASAGDLHLLTSDADIAKRGHKALKTGKVGDFLVQVPARQSLTTSSLSWLLRSLTNRNQLGA